jgi:hypothetical protein
VVDTFHELRIDNIEGKPMVFEKDQFEADQASFGPPIYNLRLSHLPRQPPVFFWASTSPHTRKTDLTEKQVAFSSLD